MKVTIESQIRCRDIPPHIKSRLAGELTIKNPMYGKLSAMNLPVWDVPRQIKFYEYENGDMVIPRGFLSRLFEIAKDTKTYISDHRFKLPGVCFKSSILLRDYQEPAVTRILQEKSGVVIMPCGAGKTVCGLEAIARIGQPTLWITHTRDLLAQSLSKAKELLHLQDGEYGIIGSGEFSIGSKITFATVQTLAIKDLSIISNLFGCVVIDEAHRCFKDHKATGQFYSVISRIPAAYRIGLTASEHRSDGLIETMFMIIGPKIYEVTQEKLRETGNVVTPTVHFIPTRFTFEKEDNEMLNFAQLIKAASEDIERNRIIIDKMLQQKEGCHSLVLSDSLEHLHLLQEMLYIKKPFIRTGFICGLTPKKERERVLSEMQKGNLDFLFATYQLAKEGLDIPLLNRLFLVTPKRDRVVIQQSVGRIMRPARSKTDAVVYDFYDSLVQTCAYQAKSRINEVYKKLGCAIIGGPVVRSREIQKVEPVYYKKY